MKIEINIEKKHLYVISALLVLVVVAVGAFAAVSNPKVFHKLLPVERIQAISPSNAVIVEDDLSVQGDIAANTVEADTVDAAGGGIVLPDDTVLGSAQDIINLIPAPATVTWSTLSGIPPGIADGDQVGVSGCLLASRSTTEFEGSCNANEVASSSFPCGDGNECYWCMSITCG